MKYAYLCAACRHLSSGHSLDEDGDLRAGPYRCRECACVVAQDHETIGLSKREYDQMFPRGARR